MIFLKVIDSRFFFFTDSSIFDIVIFFMVLIIFVKYLKIKFRYLISKFYFRVKFECVLNCFVKIV